MSNSSGRAEGGDLPNQGEGKPTPEDQTEAGRKAAGQVAQEQRQEPDGAAAAKPNAQTKP